MLKVALTGNIASGKSQVEKFFESSGIKVIDADNVVANLYTDSNFVQKMSKIFPDLIVNNIVSKDIISKIIFKDTNFKADFEKVVHKEVLVKIEEFYKKNINEKLVIVSIPLLFECNWQDKFDKIILVVSEDKIRLKRLMQRNNFTEAEAKIRLNAQIPQAQKIDKADFIIENNFSLSELQTATDEILKVLNGKTN